MKKIILFLLPAAIALGVQTAFSQQVPYKSDFSDWNVPPPVPPGTVPKGTVKNKNVVLRLPADVPVPVLKFDAALKLTASAQVLHTAPDVAAPDQPEFPDFPFKVVAIPLPLIPKSIELPQNEPRDEVSEDITNMPDPKEPDMPDLPKKPDVQEGTSGDISVRLPLVPFLLKQPVPEVTSGQLFPFDEWPVPSLPGSLHNPIVLPKGSGHQGLKSKPVKKAKGAAPKNK
jgi:hypothetical protein